MEDLIWVMKKLRKFVEKHGNMEIIFICVRTDLKKSGGNFLFVTKTKSFLKVYQKRILSKNVDINKMIFSVKNQGDIKELEELSELK